MDAILVRLREHAAFMGHPNVDHDAAGVKMMAWCDSLRSRLRTQRERLEKVREEIAMEAEGFADGGADNAEFNAAMTTTLRSWLAALDTILNEEG